MLIIEDNTAVNLDNIALEHYQNLISPLLADGRSYHKRNSLIGRIHKQRLEDLRNTQQQRVDFWDFLLNNNYANLMRIITSRPNDLKNCINEVSRLFGNALFSTHISYDLARLTAFGKIVNKVFNYDLYRKKSECGRYCAQLNLRYCPYCNEQVIQVITQGNNQKVLHQLDHFYPQARYPYLSVSFFNLIPGCSVCNSQLKSEKNFDIDTHFNPFHKRFDDYFTFELEDINCGSEEDVKIIYTNKQVYNPHAIEDFAIMERYNQAHKKIPYNIMRSLKNRSPKYRRSIFEQFKSLFRIYDNTTNRLIENLDIPKERNQINNTQLGKLKRDIAIQLGLL